MFAGLIIPIIKATVIFSSGFESGGFISDGWTATSGTPSIVTNPVLYGSYAMSCDAVEYVYKTLSPSQAVVYYRVYFRTTELPNVNNEILQLISGVAGGTNIFTVAIAYHNTPYFLRWRLSYRSGTTWTQVYSANNQNISVNTWYCIEIYWKLGTTDGAATLWIDEVQKVAVTAKDTSNYGNCDTVRCGITSITGTVTATATFDCVVVADAYIGQEGEAGISFSNIGTTTIKAGTLCIFYVNCTPLSGSLSHYIFSTNNTGTWVNDTAVAFSGTTWANTTKTLNYTTYVKVQWKVYANTSLGDWSETGIQELTTTPSNVVYAESGYWSDIQVAVDEVAAMGGGMVYIPEGTYNFVNVDESWSGTRVTIPAGVSLFGAPTERDANNQVIEWKTVLVLPWDMPSNDTVGVRTWFRLGTEGASVSKFTRFSDIKLVGPRYYDNTSKHYYNGIRVQNIIGFRIDHCHLQDICGNGITASGSSNTGKPETHYMIQGVIDHCVLNNTLGTVAPYETRTLGYGIYVNRGGGYLYENWESDITKILGQYLNYTVFVEDCYLTKWRHCVVCRQGAHVVLRHSTIQYNQGYGSIDIHGDYAGRAYEIYNVSLLDAVVGGSGSYGEGIWWRAGGGVVFNNSISGGVYDLFLYLTNENSNPSYQTFDVWIWDNTIGQGITFLSKTSGIVENEDYFLYAPEWYTPYPYPHPLTLEESPPQYSNVGFTTTVADTECKFSVKLYDYDGNMSGHIFSWNGTGTWTNNTWTSLSGSVAWANVTKTLPSAGKNVRFRWYFNDSDNLWGDTGIWSLTTTSAGTNTVALIAPDDAVNQISNLATFTYIPFFVDSIKNCSLWLNISGTWQCAAWNTTAIVNSTNNHFTFNFGAYASATYVWNIKVFSTTTGYFAQTNRTLNVMIDPVCELISHSETTKSTSCTFSAVFSDQDGLSGYIGGSNNTGTWVNQTWTPFIYGNANFTLTLNETVGNVVEYQFWANDTDGHWTASPLGTLTITANVIVVTIAYPENTTYTTSTITITMSASGGTIDRIWFNIKSGGSWLYSNTTYTAPTTKTLTNGIYTFYGWANNTDGNSDSKTVVFTVNISTTPPPPSAGFNLYFQTNGKLAFQHLSVPWETKGATVTLTVTSGTLNGTSGTLAMYTTSGKLAFTAMDNGIVSLSSTSNATTFHINGEVATSASLVNGQSYTIEWSFLEPEFLLPVMFILGMFGLGSMFGGPIYGIYKVKHGEYYEGFKTGLILTVLGVALTIAWLWGA
jgi:hypothetical protein